MKRKSELTAFTRKAFVDAFCVFYKDKPIEKITIQSQDAGLKMARNHLSRSLAH